MTSEPRPVRRVAFMTLELSLGSIVYSNVKWAKKFLEAGYEVDFVGLESLNADHVELLPPEIGCFDLKSTRVATGPAAFARYLNERRPEIAFVSCHLQILIGCLGARLANYNPKLVLRAHVSTTRLLERQQTFFDRHLLPYAIRMVAPSGAVFAAVSQAGAADFAAKMGLAEGKVLTLYDPVLPLELRELPPVDHPWLDDPALRTVVAVGRLAPEKDFGTLIRAFAKVRGKRADARLLIIGEGPERPLLEAVARECEVEDAVALIGAADPRNAYAKGSVFAVSSIYEGLCNVIIEAMAYGMPVVSTDCPVGPAEILERGRYGALVAVGDDAAMAEAILHALDRPADKSLLIERAMDFHVDRLWPDFAAAAGLGPA